MISSKKNKTYKAPHKGVFKPKNPKKYVGDSNNIVYRSSWEKKFMLYCDRNKDIVEWASEEIVIPYVSPVDHRPHRYFPDFYIKVKQHNGGVKKMIIESFGILCLFSIIEKKTVR